MRNADYIRPGSGQVATPLGLLESVFAQAPLGLEIFAADGHCLLSNRAFRDLFGAPPAAGYDILHDQAAERCGLAAAFRRALSGEAVHAERLRCPRGMASAWLFPLHGAAGTIEHVAALFEDATAEARAREAAEVNERTLRQLVEDTVDLVFVKDRQGRYVIANPASARVARRPLAEIVGHTDEEVFPPEQARALRAIDRRVAKRGATETYDESFEVDGELRYFSTAKTPRRDEHGRPDGIIGISRDITDRKRAEAALAAEELWLETILEHTPTPLVFVEPGTARLFFANAAADRIAGGALARPARAADYARLFDMRDLDDRPLTVDHNPLVRAARGEVLVGVQLRWHLPAGAKVVAMQSARLPAVHGHAETVLVAFDDITALKEVQTALEEAVRARQDFLSIAGHELKTPLTALLLVMRSVDRALSRPRAGGPDHEARSLLDGDPRLADRWRSLQGQVGRLSGLVDQLLDVSRLAARKLTLDIEPLDLVEVAREVVGRFVAAAGDGGVAPILLLARQPVRGRWDRLRLEQVITNLVSNALKYGDRRPVTVSVRGADDAITLSVRDEGIGIAPEALDRIFDRFERAATTRHYGGLGLGLWIVRQLVEAMGGTVSVDSELGKGSTFTLRFPRAS